MDNLRKRQMGRVLFVALSVLVAAPAYAQAPISPDIIDELLDFNTLVTAVIIAVAAVVGARFLSAGLDGLGERFASRRLLLKKISSLGRFTIYLSTSVFIIVGVIQPRRETLIAIFGALAVAVGLAMKDLVGSIIAGVIVLIDAPFQVGDRVQYGNTYGEVVDIGLRAVQIQTLDDNLVSIPNNKFLNDVVASANAGDLDMMVEIDFYIGVDEDHRMAKRIVQEATVTSRFVYLKKPVAVHVLDKPIATTYATRLKTKFYISDTRFETAVKTDITDRVKRHFRLHNIRAPYGHHAARMDGASLAVD